MQQLSCNTVVRQTGCQHIVNKRVPRLDWNHETAEGRVPKEIPQPVLTYNQFMGGVDLHDQYRSYYGIGRTVKWWRNLAWFLFQVSVINAYQVYKHYYMRNPSTVKLLNHFQFRLEIIREMRQPSLRKRTKEMADPTSAVQKCTTVRLLSNKKRCVQCLKNGRKSVSGRGVDC